VTYAVGKPPVLVYADREGSSCPYPKDVDRILGACIEEAFRNHLGAMMRFVGELGPQYAGLLELRLERTDNRDGASVVVVVKQLEGNIAGVTYLSIDAPVVIELDCGLGRPPHSAMAILTMVILHELYHALGIGHVEPARFNKLMGAPPGPAPPPFPSSLDALALWELWFSGNTYTADEVNYTLPNYTLPGGFPYVLLLPYNETISQLQGEVSDLRGRLGTLTTISEQQRREIDSLNQILKQLQNDIVVLEQNLTASREEVARLSAKNEALRAENARLAGRVGELEYLLAGRETALANLSRAAEGLRAALGEREGQVASLVAKVAELQEKLKRAEAWGQVLFYTVLVLVPLALMVPVALALIRRRERR
jgi:uncharacterized coiled-coil protein SlyX